MVTQSLPYWPINPSINYRPEGIWYTFQLDFVRAMWAMLPAAMLDDALDDGSGNVDLVHGNSSIP